MRHQWYKILGFMAVWHFASLGSAGAAPAEDHWSVTPNEALHELLVKAQHYITQKKYGLAVTLLTEAIETNSGAADVWNLMGYSQRKQGKLKESGEAYANALRLDPNHLGALEYQGELFLLLGDLSQAENNLARLRVLCPSGCEERLELKRVIDTYRLNN